MQLTIFAATGGVGRHLLEQARAAGHDVTAVARNPSPLPAGVPTVTADLAAIDRAALQAGVAGADGVLSCLGPRSSQRRDGITSRGTRAIIAAMQATGARRIAAMAKLSPAVLDALRRRIFDLPKPGSRLGIPAPAEAHQHGHPPGR